jgi:hypothetical protein
MARTDSGDALTGPRLKKPSSVAIHCNHKERRIDSHMASASDAPMLTSRCPKSARLHGISVTYHSSEGANQLLPSGSALLVQTGTRKSARQRSLWVRSQGPISASNSDAGTHATAGTEFGGSGWSFLSLFLSTHRCGITLLPYFGPCS